MQPILSLSDYADHGHYHGAYHRSRADSAYLAYHAIGLLPVFTQQPCRSEIEQDTENEQYAYADPVIDLHFQCPISSFPQPNTLSSFLSPASVCRKLRHRPTGCNRRYLPLAHLRLYTRCGPAHRLSLQVILFYQVDIILSHPVVNLNVSAALQNTFSDLTNFFFVFLAGTLYFLCTLSVSISLLYCIFSSILRKPNFIPQSGRRNFFKCCTPKTKNAASRSWS